MAEWLDPDNLEDPENTTQALLDELAEESDQVAAEVEFWPVGVEVGNVRNNSEPPSKLKEFKDCHLENHSISSFESPILTDALKLA